MSSLKDKKDTDLYKELSEKRKSLREFRFGIAGSKVKNIKEARNLRRGIASLLTEVNSRKTN